MSEVSELPSMPGESQFFSENKDIVDIVVLTVRRLPLKLATNILSLPTRCSARDEFSFPLLDTGWSRTLLWPTGCSGNDVVLSLKSILIWVLQRNRVNYARRFLDEFTGRKAEESNMAVCMRRARASSNCSDQEAESHRTRGVEGVAPTRGWRPRSFMENG